jgi:hypothetical protein
MNNVPGSARFKYSMEKVTNMVVIKMASSGMLHRVALVRTDVSEELSLVT